MNLKHEEDTVKSAICIKQYYEGDLLNEEPHGKGRCVDFIGDEYVGEWNNGKKHGAGVLTFSTGGYYQGEWKNNLKDGYGTFKFANGNIYEGQWKDNHICGTGKLTCQDGFVYTGEWTTSENGKGKITHTSGAESEYEGEWKNLKHDGQGKITSANGVKYEGDWKLGVREGRGKTTDLYGCIYEGEWRNGKAFGNGKYTFKSKTYQVEGEWNKHTVVKDVVQLQGVGRLAYSNGDVYEGEIQGRIVCDSHNRRALGWFYGSGEGKFVSSSGYVQHGLWEHGQLSKGKFVASSGDVQDGTWGGRAFLKGIKTFSNGDAFIGEWDYSGGFKHGTKMFAKSGMTCHYRDGKCIGFSLPDGQVYKYKCFLLLSNKFSNIFQVKNKYNYKYNKIN